MRLAPAADEPRARRLARPARRAAACPDRRALRPSRRDISLVLTQEGGRRIALAIPPAIAPASDVVQSELVDPFHKTLTGDLGVSPWFVLADPALYPKGFRPPATREEGRRLDRLGRAVPPRHADPVGGDERRRRRRSFSTSGPFGRS